MGMRFRKSIGKGAFRVNISKSGIGYSVGTKGFRVTKTANGRTRTTTSIPGTGISHVSESKSKKKNNNRVVDNNIASSNSVSNGLGKKFNRVFYGLVAAILFPLSLLISLVEKAGYIGIAISIICMIVSHANRNKKCKKDIMT